MRIESSLDPWLSRPKINTLRNSCYAAAMAYFEEGGMTEKDFTDAQEERLKENIRYAAQERERAAKLYFEFSSREMRDKAIQALNKLRDEKGAYDERFSFFLSCGIDLQRPDVGMEVHFSKNPQNLEEGFEQLLKEQSLLPGEEYETVDGKPQPEKTKINRAAA